MPIKCEQCGETFERAVNFCRKCGAPLPTSSAVSNEPNETQQMPSVVNMSSTTRHLSVEPSANDVSTQILASDAPATAHLAQNITSEMAKPATTASMSAKEDKGTAPVSQTPAAQPQGTGTAPIVEATTAQTGSNKTLIIGLAAVALLVAGFIGFKYLQSGKSETSTAVAVSEPTPTAENQATPDTSGSAAAAPTGTASKSATPNLVAKASPTAKVSPSGTPSTVAEATPAYPQPEPTKAAPEKAAPTENPATLIEQGNRLASAGQLQEAIQTFEKARRANPGNADVYYLLGSAYHRSGDLANALASYRQCTSGPYAAVAANHVKNLEKKLSKGK